MNLRPAKMLPELPRGHPKAIDLHWTLTTSIINLHPAARIKYFHEMNWRQSID
jgi:hypothetical protein